MTNQKVWELSKQVQTGTMLRDEMQVLITHGAECNLYAIGFTHEAIGREVDRARKEYPGACIIVRDNRGVIVYTVNERALEVEPVDRWANEGEHDTAFNEGV